MSRAKKKFKLTDLEVVPYEKSIPYYLEKNRDELVRREAARIEENRKAREATKNIVVGGPLDKKNK